MTKANKKCGRIKYKELKSEVDMKITDLRYNVKIWDSNKAELRTMNIFNSYRVIKSLAIYIKRSDPKSNDSYFKDQYKTVDDVIHFIFGDTQGRCEWEYVVSEWAGKEGRQKVDVYEMYVEPNKYLLYNMIKEVSYNSAVMWLREDRKRYGRK